VTTPEPGIYERVIPEGADLASLGVDIDDITTLGGVHIVGGGMWGGQDQSGPIGAVILIPIMKDRTEMAPLAIIQSPEGLRRLRDQLTKVFSMAADAAEELFARDGELPGDEQ